MFVRNTTVFVGRNEKEVKELCTKIMEYTNIPCYTESYLEGYGIYLDTEINKDIVSLVGNLVCVLNKYDNNDMKWVIEGVRVQDINKIKVLKLSFDGKGRRVDYENCIQNFKKMLIDNVKVPIQVENDYKVPIQVENDYFEYYFYFKITDFISPKYVDDMEKIKKFLINYNNTVNSINILTNSYNALEGFNFYGITFKTSIECYNFKGKLINNWK